MNKYGLRLKELREQAGYTQEQLAKLLNISRSRLSMYEQGKREPDFEMQEVFADFFNVSLDYIAGRKEFSVAPVIKAIEKSLTASDTPTFTTEELLVIAAYREADIVGKQAVQRILQIEDDIKKGISIS